MGEEHSGSCPQNSCLASQACAISTCNHTVSIDPSHNIVWTDVCFGWQTSAGHSGSHKKDQNGCYQTHFVPSKYTECFCWLGLCPVLRSGSSQRSPDLLARLGGHLSVERERIKKGGKGRERKGGYRQEGKRDWPKKDGLGLPSLKHAVSRHQWLATCPALKSKCHPSKTHDALSLHPPLPELYGTMWIPLSTYLLTWWKG